MTLLSYKLRRTFRPWDVITVGGMGCAIAALCIWAMLTPQDMPLHGWIGLMATAVMALGIVFAFFWRRWEFWRRVEYVTEQGIAVMASEELRPQTISDRKWQKDRDGVEDVTEHVIRWWSNPSLDFRHRMVESIRVAVPHLRDVAWPHEKTVRRTLARCILIWHPYPYRQIVRGHFWRWVAGLSLGEYMEVGWRPDVWTTALAHEMGHCVLHLCCGIYGEQRVHKLFVDLGYTDSNVRAA